MTTTPFAAITRAELSEGDMLQDEAVRYIIECGLDEKIARSTGPLTRYNDMFCLNTMTDAIKVHGTCLGRVMMIERNHAFGDSDREVFEFFVRLLAQELQKGGFLSMGGPQQGPYFLSRLLDDEIPNPITCTRKMQLVGFTPLPALYVVCLLKKIPSSRRARRRASEDNCSRCCTIALSPCTRANSWRW